MRNISSESVTKETPKNTKQSKNASDTKEEGSRDTLYLLSLDAYSRSASREMWIQCIQCKLWAHEQLMAAPSLFAQIARPMDRNTLFNNECCWCCYIVLALLLISFFGLSKCIPF